VFGDTLEKIMERQIKQYPKLELPLILTALTHAVLKAGGSESEGIFRVPGDAEQVSELRCRIEVNNNYTMDYLSGNLI
jgi:hypothetical protein